MSAFYYTIFQMNDLSHDWCMWMFFRLRFNIASLQKRFFVYFSIAFQSRSKFHLAFPKNLRRTWIFFRINFWFRVFVKEKITALPKMNSIVLFSCERCGATFFNRTNLRLTTVTCRDIFFWINQENMHNVYVVDRAIFCSGCKLPIGSYNFSTFLHWVATIRYVSPHSFIVSMTS